MRQVIQSSLKLGREGWISKLLEDALGQEVNQGVEVNRTHTTNCQLEKPVSHDLVLANHRDSSSHLSYNLSHDERE